MKQLWLFYGLYSPNKTRIKWHKVLTETTGMQDNQKHQISIFTLPVSGGGGRPAKYTASQLQPCKKIQKNSEKMCKIANSQVDTEKEKMGHHIALFMIPLCKKIYFVNA